MTTKIQAIVQKVNELKAMMQDQGKAALSEAFQDFFNKHPGITSIAWVQYTPHFNDGDACTFGVREFEARGDIEDLGDTSDEDEEYERYSYGENCIVSKLKRAGGLDWYRTKTRELTAEEQQLVEDFDRLQSDCMSIEEVLQLVLGDHVQVTATIDGFEVEEWDHD